MSDGTRDLLIRGIAAAKARETTEARRYLEWALNTDADPDQKIEILWWLSEICENPGEQRKLVEEILANRPTESRARRKLAILDGHLKPEEMIDPDHIPAPQAGERDVDASRFTCPKCGGRMTFAPDGQSLDCEYCESHESLKNSQSEEVFEQDFILALSTLRGHRLPTHYQFFVCQGCAASFILAASQLTLTCPYCDSAYVVQQNEALELVTPAGVVPFNVTERQAKQDLAFWLSTNLNEKDVHVAQGAALYLPAWTFDLAGELTWRGYKPHKRGQEPIPLSGRHPVLINDLIIPATHRLSNSCLAELAQFDLSALVPYDDRFLVNWPAETYQLSAADASLEARRLALRSEQGRLLSRLDVPVNDLAINSAGLAVASYRLILLPVWLTHYIFKDHRYEVVINGHSGTVRAEKPASKIARWLGLS